MKHKLDSLYPYTYADDYVRSIVGCNEQGAILSRSDASQIISAIAKVIGMEDIELFHKLADAQLDKTDDDYKKEAQRAIASMYPHCERDRP